MTLPEYLGRHFRFAHIVRLMEVYEGDESLSVWWVRLPFGMALTLETHLDPSWTLTLSHPFGEIP